MMENDQPFEELNISEFDNDILINSEIRKNFTNYINDYYNSISGIIGILSDIEIPPSRKCAVCSTKMTRKNKVNNKHLYICELCNYKTQRK